MEKGLYYLAIPYLGTEEEKKYRTELSLKTAAEFYAKGFICLLPSIMPIKSLKNLS